MSEEVNDSPPRSKRKTHDLTGRRFCGWFVVSKGRLQRNGRVWVCRCVCGVIREVQAFNLLSGSSRSCGCLKGVVRKNSVAGGHFVDPKVLVEKKTKSKERAAWSAAKRRCYNPKERGYADYGGRGLWMCERWKNGFKEFLKDIGPASSPQHSLDRIDNDCGYCCGRCPDCFSRGVGLNCRWATVTEQARNKRNLTCMEIDGFRLSISDWSKLTGIPYRTLKDRFKKGWKPEEILRHKRPVLDMLRVDWFQPSQVGLLSEFCWR